MITKPPEYRLCAPLQLLKERASGMYKAVRLLFCAHTPQTCRWDLAIPTVFILIVYFMSGLRTDGAKYFFENYFSVVLVREVASWKLSSTPNAKMQLLVL